jgi:hypothetical protein
LVALPQRGKKKKKKDGCQQVKRKITFGFFCLSADFDLAHLEIIVAARCDRFRWVRFYDAQLLVLLWNSDAGNSQSYLRKGGFFSRKGA